MQTCKKAKPFAWKGNMKEKQSLLAKNEHMHRRSTVHALLLVEVGGMGWKNGPIIKSGSLLFFKVSFYVLNTVQK